jgi:hypothetical protein
VFSGGVFFHDPRIRSGGGATAKTGRRGAMT